MAPTSSARAAIASGSRASRRRRSQFPSVDSLSKSMSLAMTRAPSRVKSSAVARPMPWAAAVTNAVFPASRDIESSRCASAHGLDGQDEERAGEHEHHRRYEQPPVIVSGEIQQPRTPYRAQDLRHVDGARENAEVFAGRVCIHALQ